MNRMPSRLVRHAIGALIALALAACATAPGATAPGATAPGSGVAGGEAPPERNIDPLEPFNRGVWAFNEAIDGAVLKPLATVYDRYTPEVIRLIVGNVLSNLLDPYIAANNLLQGKPGAAASDVGRFLLNSTFGFFGFGDPASDIGLQKHREDFGQTLGVWGVPTGPYLVLPVFGPSNVRDGIGFGVDYVAAVANRFDNVGLRNTLTGVGLMESRARLLPADRMLADALDRYLLVRDGFLQRRRSLVYDGDPPDAD
jgi:phospholipid-binding lipoprotein MlaA